MTLLGAGRMRGRRLLAAAVDLALGLALALLLAGSSGHFFAGRAVVALRIGAEGTLWRGPLPMILGYLGPLSYGLPFALLLVHLAEPLFGLTPGKLFAGLAIAGSDGAPAGTSRLWLRTAVKCGGLCLLVLALLAGSWQLAALGVLVTLVFLLGALPALLPSGRSLHDRLAGTALRRR